MAVSIISTRDASHTDEHQDRADALAMQLFELTNIVQMAAFATEARRTLQNIDELKMCNEQARILIDGGIERSNAWCEIEDKSSEVLQRVAQRLEQINYDTMDALAHAAPPKSDVPGSRQHLNEVSHG